MLALSSSIRSSTDIWSSSSAVRSAVPCRLVNRRELLLLVDFQRDVADRHNQVTGRPVGLADRHGMDMNNCGRCSAASTCWALPVAKAVEGTKVGAE